MNERIKELAEQAGYEKDMFGVGHWDMPECKKFAELIVWECMLICEDVMKKDNSALGCWIEIKRKFRS
jgi:hypothetical protein